MGCDKRLDAQPGLARRAWAALGRGAVVLALLCAACTMPGAQRPVSPSSVGAAPTLTPAEAGAASSPSSLEHDAPTTPGEALTATVTALPAPTASSTAELPAWPEEPTSEEAVRTQYHLIASLDTANRLLSVEERVVFPNRTGREIDTLVLIVEPQRLSPRFDLLEIYWQDGTPVEPYTLEEGVLRIPLPAPLAPGEQAALGLAFVFRIPPEAAALGGSPRQINLADWYAFIPVYGSDGWQVHAAAGVGEHLVYAVSDFRVELRLEPGDDEAVVAAPVPPVEEGGGVRRYDYTQARNFTLSISREYVTLQDPLGVRVFVFPEHRAAGETALGCVSEALELYSRLFGDPALQWMNVIEADFPDGMEYDGLFFLNWQYFEYPGVGAASGLCTLSAHETAHQWWYRLVGSDPAEEPWLDEALCTFSELIFYEQLHPDLVNWWWGYRVNDYNPQGWVNSAIYDHDDYRLYVNAVYLQGARFLDSLRRSASYSAMLDFLAAYAAAHRFGEANEEAFFSLWQKVTGVDPGPVRERFFR